MRYMTHQFAHLDTMERARRWLELAGIDPSRIEVHTDGIPRLSVAVEAGESAEVGLLIAAAESADPDGNPSFWDLARQKHIYPVSPAATPEPETRSQTFVVSWRPMDWNAEINQATTEIELQKAYRDGRE